MQEPGNESELDSSLELNDDESDSESDLNDENLMDDVANVEALYNFSETTGARKSAKTKVYQSDEDFWIPTSCTKRVFFDKKYQIFIDFKNTIFRIWYNRLDWYYYYLSYYFLWIRINIWGCVCRYLLSRTCGQLQLIFIVIVF